jgi:hypothetical protein
VEDTRSFRSWSPDKMIAIRLVLAKQWMLRPVRTISRITSHLARQSGLVFGYAAVFALALVRWCRSWLHRFRPGRALTDGAAGFLPQALSGADPLGDVQMISKWYSLLQVLLWSERGEKSGKVSDLSCGRRY